MEAQFHAWSVLFARPARRCRTRPARSPARQRSPRPRHHVSGQMDANESEAGMLCGDQFDRLAGFETSGDENPSGRHQAGVVDGVADDDEFQVQVAPYRVAGAGEQDVVALVHPDRAHDADACSAAPLRPRRVASRDTGRHRSRHRPHARRYVAKARRNAAASACRYRRRARRRAAPPPETPAERCRNAATAIFSFKKMAIVGDAGFAVRADPVLRNSDHARPRATRAGRTRRSRGHARRMEGPVA